MSMHSLFDASERQKTVDLYGPRAAHIQSAAQHAELLDDTFNPAAHAFLAKFAREQHMFTGEDVTRAAALTGLVAPCHGAWGSIFRRAQNKTIRRIDYLPRQNGNPAPLYASLVYGGDVA